MTGRIVRAVTTVAAVLLAAVPIYAGTPTTVDARSLFTFKPVKTLEQSQVLGFQRTMDLQLGQAQGIFQSAPKDLVLTNFPLPNNESSTLELHRTTDVFDATTQFVKHTKQGLKTYTVRPIASYVGTVRGEQESRVVLHYTREGLMGMIDQRDGSRILIDRSTQRPTSGTVLPHVVADERVVLPDHPMKQFLCGTVEGAYDAEAVHRSRLAMPSKPLDQMQADDDLREIKLAMVLKEDIDSTMKARGFTDEGIAQYFAAIISCMNQVYEEEMHTRFFVTYLESFTDDSPSPYSYNGLDPGALLEEFSGYWATNMSFVDRDVAHLFTLIRSVGQGMFVGGIAFGGNGATKLCARGFGGGYGVSTVYLDRNTEMPGRPSVRNGFTWDYFVISHEIGHNLGAWHTHNCAWEPPLDTCQTRAQGTDGCVLTGNGIRRDGTIMSYCHLVNGSSTPFTFGTRVAERMRGWIENSCAQRPARPVLEITSPRGSAEYSAAQTMTIRWSSIRVSKVNLQYSANNGTSWNDIATDLDAVSRSFSWTIPSMEAASILIRAFDPSAPTVGDTSLAQYSITSSLELVAPNANNTRYAQGSTVGIQWGARPGLGPVRLLWSPTGTAPWETLIAAAAENVQSYTWTVPAIVTSKGRFRVEFVDNPSVFRESPDIAIGVRSFTLVSPRNGDSLCTNFDNTFVWYSDFVTSRIRIQFKTADGSWQSVIPAPSVETSAERVSGRSTRVSDLPNGTPVSIRVVEFGVESEPLAVLEELTAKACGDAPVGVDETPVVNVADLRLNGVVPNPASNDVMLTVDLGVPTPITVEALAADGSRSVLLQQYSMQAGSGQSVRVPVTALASGAYQLVVRAGGVVVSKPLSIVR